MTSPPPRALPAIGLGDVLVAALIFSSDLDVSRLGLPPASRWALLAPLWSASLALVVFSRSLRANLLAAPTVGLALWTVIAVGSASWSHTPGPSLVLGLGMASLVVAGSWYVPLFGWRRFAVVATTASVAFLWLGFVTELTVGGRPGAGFRLSGLTFGPTSIAVFAAFALVLASAVAVEPGAARSTRLLGRVGIVTAFVALLWSNGRGATVAALTALAVVAAMRLGAWRFGQLVAVLGVSVFLAGSALGLGVSSLSRSGDITELTTFTGRTAVWEIALDVVADRPLLGHGTASSRDLFVAAAADGKISWRAFDAHNVWFGLLVEQGLLGTLSFALAVAGVARRWRGIGPWPLGVAVVFAVNGLTEALTFRPTVALLVLAAAAAAATSRTALGGPASGVEIERWDRIPDHTRRRRGREGVGLEVRHLVAAGEAARVE